MGCTIGVGHRRYCRWRVVVQHHGERVWELSHQQPRRRVRLRQVLSLTLFVAVWWLRSPHVVLAERTAAVTDTGGEGKQDYRAGYQQTKNFSVAFGFIRLRPVMQRTVSGGCVLRFITTLMGRERWRIPAPFSAARGISTVRPLGASRSASQDLLPIFHFYLVVALSATFRWTASSCRRGRRIILRSEPYRVEGRRVRLLVMLLTSGCSIWWVRSPVAGSTYCWCVFANGSSTSGGSGKATATELRVAFGFCCETK